MIVPLELLFNSGVNRFIDDVKMMIGFRLNYYWLVTWAVVTPIVLCVSTNHVILLVLSLGESASINFGL